ncbi:MAG: RloB family protein [bacterium]|nr:RloB family protein [bacterium]
MSKNPFERKANIRTDRKLLIVCEGKKTEPNYFKKFPINKELIKVKVEGPGYNTDSLLEEAIRLKNEAYRRGKSYNEVWCVFDRDSNPAQNFNRAFQLAEDNKIRIAYSNEAFELWYVLHFKYLTTQWGRAQYSHDLNNLLPHPYKKNSTTMYTDLEENQETAIKNAKRLLDWHKGCKGRLNPEQDKPSTTVHRLVERLNEFIEVSE